MSFGFFHFSFYAHSEICSIIITIFTPFLKNVLETYQIWMFQSEIKNSASVILDYFSRKKSGGC